ncbi:MAG: hypothetical protein AABY22_07400 [Nanoarchaeota archaeon]
MAQCIKKRNRYFIREPKITTQFLGFGKTKKEAINDFNDSLNHIFSNKKDRVSYKIKNIICN